MQTSAKQKPYLYKLFLLVAAIIWGSSFVVFKTTLNHLPPALIISCRFFIAFCLLFIVCFKRLKNITVLTVLCGFVIGAAMALSYFFQTMGLKTTTPGKNAFLTSAYCIIVPFLYWLFSKRKPDIYNLSAAFLLVLGIGLVYLGDANGLNKGDLLTLFSTLFIALQIVFAAMFLRLGDLYIITLFQFATGAIISFFLHIIFEPRINLFSAPPAAFMQILYMGIFATFITLLFQNIGQKHTPPAQASLILSLEAVFGVIFSVIFFGERPTLTMLAGFLIILIAIIVSETKPKFKRINIDKKL